VPEAVYRGSTLERSAALEQLEQGSLQVIFSVDLFNEGVDLPAIDTLMMLRPTESKVLFLQQLGRGLRRHPAKERLVVLDFIGNHQGFLNKPQALFAIERQDASGDDQYVLRLITKQPDGRYVLKASVLRKTTLRFLSEDSEYDQMSMNDIIARIRRAALRRGCRR